MRRFDLPRRLVLQQVRPRAVEDPRRAARQRGRALDRVAVGLGAVELDGLVADERVEHADGVRAAADARDDLLRQLLPVGVEELLARLLADDRLEVADDRREGVRADGRADEVVRVADVGDPIPKSLVDRVLESRLARPHGDDFRAEDVHAEHVERLARAVDGAHVDDTFEPEESTYGGGRDAVLAGARLGDDARLAQSFREERLADGVVDLVRPRVRELLALEPDLRAADALGEPLRVVQRRRPADELPSVLGEFLEEGRIRDRRGVLGLQPVVRRGERLGNVPPAERAEVVGERRRLLRGLFCRSRIGCGRRRGFRSSSRHRRGVLERPHERFQRLGARRRRLVGVGVEVPDDRRPHDDAVGAQRRDRRDVLGRRHAEPHSQRRGVLDGASHAAQERREVHRLGRRAARDAEHRDAVHHGTARLRGGFGERAHARVRRRRRDHRDVPEPDVRACLEHTFQRRLFGRQVDDDEAVNARGFRVGRELLEAVRAERVVVAHQQDRDRQAVRFARCADRLEAVAEADALLQRDFVALLDRRAVGHGVRERHAELDHVGAAVFERFHEGGGFVARGIPARQVPHEPGRPRVVGAALPERGGDARAASITERLVAAAAANGGHV
mmetsp:Transcript_18585/g.74182  ORF Transcript_18585/g.74182 Transcript_18585/m.74182 type:complete len:620 (+) Transcript_18585:561-2420(+)